MLKFYSANVRIANVNRAVDECLDIAFGEKIPADCRVIMVQAAVGHPLGKLSAALTSKLPNAAVLCNSCAGVIGKAGVGESMHDIAMVAVCGPESEVAYSSVDEIYGHNS